nr:hypothetical protein GCM10020093_069890 [Planobispora longispora]
MGALGEFPLGGDLPVHRIGFGAMRLPAGTFQGPARDPAAGVAVLRRAVELGVDHIDTAWFYRRGGVAANELIRTALAPHGDGLVIATKVGPLFGSSGVPGGQAARTGCAAWWRRTCAASAWTGSTSSTSAWEA